MGLIEKLSLWCSRVAAIALALFILGVALPGVKPDEANVAAVRISFVCIVAASVVLVFIGRGRRIALQWTGWAVLVVLAFAVIFPQTIRLP